VPHARDRRTTLAEITSQGRKVVIPATRQIAGRLRLGISDEQAEEVFALIQKLRRSAGEMGRTVTALISALSTIEYAVFWLASCSAEVG
jgi:hypothetical protein